MLNYKSPIPVTRLSLRLAPEFHECMFDMASSVWLPVLEDGSIEADRF
jgi:hypothetical protein